MQPIKSTVLKSLHFGTIMNKYEQIGQTMSIRAFYNEHVKQIDPTISSRKWASFMTRYNEQVQIKAQILMEKIADKEIKATEMEEDSLKKILAIADLSLDEVVKNPKLLTAIPISQRMQWLFSAMSARDSRMLTLTKVQTEKRKTSLYEDMLEGAQYGAIDAEEAEDEAISLEESSSFTKQDKPKSGKIIEFSPKQLEHAS